jgi:hypothetical protein
MSLGKGQLTIFLVAYGNRKFCFLYFPEPKGDEIPMLGENVSNSSVFIEFFELYGPLV